LKFQIQFLEECFNANSALLIRHLMSGFGLVKSSPLVVEVYHKLLLIVVDGELAENSAPFNRIAHLLEPLMQ